MEQNSSPADKTKIILVSIFLGILLFTFGILLGLVLRQNGLQLPMLAKQIQAISIIRPTSMILPTSVTQESTLLNVSQLDMLFFKGSISPDQATVTLDIKLINKGVNPITLTNEDLSVAPEGGAATLPTTVTPALPQEIAPGARLRISVMFLNPKTPSVVLRILDLTISYFFQ